MGITPIIYHVFFRRKGYLRFLIFHKVYNFHLFLSFVMKSIGKLIELEFDSESDGSYDLRDLNNLLEYKEFLDYVREKRIVDEKGRLFEALGVDKIVYKKNGTYKTKVCVFPLLFKETLSFYSRN